MKRRPRLILFVLALAGLAGIAGGALAIDQEREAALERARAEQSLILSEPTALMLGELFNVSLPAEEPVQDNEGDQ